MKKKLVFISLLIFVNSCKKRIVQLPETPNNEITKILDVSPIYIFYSEETGEAEFNRANLIGTTNWLVNVDKRLTLEQVLPHLQYLQKKRNKRSMHKNDAARNYFTCSNPEAESLAFIDFTEIEYRNELYKKYLKLNSDVPNNIRPIEFHSLQSVNIYDSTGKLVLEKDITSVINYLEEYNESVKLISNFLNEISFQDYISIKSKLALLKNDKIEISNKEFIFN
jgi:hypothetical protein